MKARIISISTDRVRELLNDGNIVIAAGFQGIDENLNIVRVLPDVSGPKAEAYFVYAEELRHSMRISVFRDFLIKKVHEAKF